MNEKERLKQRILNEMVYDESDIEREKMVMEICSEYPELNNPKDREKMKQLPSLKAGVSKR